MSHRSTATRTIPTTFVLLAAALCILISSPAFAQRNPPATGERVWATHDQTGVDHGLPDAARSGSEAVEPFFPGISYDPNIATPEDVLGFAVGARPAWHAEVIAYMEALAGASPRAELVTYATSHEGRRLVALLVSTAANIARREEIQRDLARWADPRADDPPAIEGLPACVYVAATVHGDETSGCDAALALAHHLVAAEDAETAALRERLLVLVDPLQNPDGHDRVLAQWLSIAGRVPDGDDQSLRHQGVWPGGRTNHYLFDLNRDWYLATQPESRGRLRLITSWNPQVLIDAHEMGSHDTYLFSPPREPFNPMITDYQHHWWRVFAGDQAAAFDQYGWDYYTREWHEEWFPGFASSWGNGIGAIGILYEQAGVEGSRVSRRDGTVLDYRETVHHQAVSFVANLLTASRNREELLRGFRAERERILSNAGGVYVIVPHAQPARAAFLLRALLAQGIEVHRSTRDLELGGLRPYWADAADDVQLPAGTLFIPSRQPFHGLVETILAFDPQMGEEFLTTERRRLERERRTRLYDVTAWSVAQACGLPAYHADQVPWRSLERVTAEPEERGSVIRPEAGFGFLIDGCDDRALHALVGLWEVGLRVHAALESFTVEGRAYPRGTLLVKRALQPEPPAPTAPAEDWLASVLRDVAVETGVTFIGVNTALSDEGPDLGGQRFRYLREPRIAVVTGGPVSWSSYGATAWLLDHQMGMPISVLWMTDLSRRDLSRYNVIVLPDFWDGPAGGHALGSAGVDRLRGWVRDGGTLVAVGNAAAFLADSSQQFGSVRPRRQVLGRLADLAAREGDPRGDLIPEEFDREELHWAKAPGPMDGLIGEGMTSLRRPEPFWAWAAGRSSDELRAEDERMRLFHPRGPILRVDLDERHWLTAGCEVALPGRPWMPAPIYSEYALVAGDPLQVIGAFASEDSLRLSGLLWPEGRERWARTAYLTREAVGQGQVILFAGLPCIRGAFKPPQRAFLNAVLAGPGMGAPRGDAWR